MNDEIIFSSINEFASACACNYIAKQKIEQIKEFEQKEKEGKIEKKEIQIKTIIAKQGQKQKKTNKKRKKYEDLFFSLDNSWYTDLNYLEEEKNFMSILKKTNQLLNRKIESNISYSYNSNILKRNPTKVKKTLKKNKALKKHIELEKSPLIEETEIINKSPIIFENNDEQNLNNKPDNTNNNNDEIIFNMSDNDDL